MSILARIHSSLKERRIRWTPGIDTIWSGKWLVVTMAYILAVGLMARDPWFGDCYFAWNQGVIVILLSFIVVSTLCFEWHLMGRTEGINVFLQFLLIFPVALFLGRIIGKPWNYSGQQGLLGEAASFIKDIVNASGISSLVPRPLQELFSSPGLAVFLVLVCVALSFGNRKSTRIGLLLTAILIPLAGALSYTPRPSPSFFLGVALLLFGATLQFLDVNKYFSDLNILTRLKHVVDEAERRCSIRIAKRAFEEGRVTEQTVLETVRRCYAEQHNFEPEAVHLIARSLSHRLVHEHGLLSVNLSADGLFLEPAKNLHVYDSLLAEVSLWPRSIILAGIAILWWLSPLDIIPDAVPIIGTIDDILLLWLGGTPLIKQIASMRNRRSLRGSDLDSPAA